MFTAFIGGTQRPLPKRNFARFLLMMFLIFSLVIRTVYQGAFYQLLKSNKRHKGVQSMDEIVKSDFQFFIIAGASDFVKSVGISKDR